MIRSPMPSRSKSIKPSTKRMKSSSPKMTPARKAARGKPCMVRLPGCDGGGESTVLAHYRLAGYCGTSIKPPDEMGAWACIQCHDRIDGRVNCGLTKAELRLAHAEGVMRTQQAVRGEECGGGSAELHPVPNNPVVSRR